MPATEAEKKKGKKKAFWSCVFFGRCCRRWRSFNYMLPEQCGTWTPLNHPLWLGALLCFSLHLQLSPLLPSLSLPALPPPTASPQRMEGDDTGSPSLCPIPCLQRSSLGPCRIFFLSTSQPTSSLTLATGIAQGLLERWRARLFIAKLQCSVLNLQRSSRLGEKEYLE